MADDQITLLYACRCGLKDAAFSVRQRHHDEDVIAWMRGIVEPALTADHSRRSPDCRSKAVDYLKVPLPPGSKFIGGPVEH